MAMLWTVFRVEWRSARRERALWAVLALFTVLATYASVSGWALVRTEATVAAGAQAEDRGRLARLRAELVAMESGAAPRHATDPRSPHVVGRDLAPRAAVLPPGPLAMVAVGQRDVLPQVVELTTRPRVSDPARDDGKSPSLRASGSFDLAFVFVFLLPLVVVALAYDLLTGERERGTLALVLAQPVSLRTFVLGKALSRAAILLATVGVLGLATPLALGGPVATAGGPLRLGLYAALLVAYVAFWFFVALAVDAWGRSSAANALSLVALWLLFVVIVPGLASVAVDTIHPSPSRVELVNLAREAARDAESTQSSLEGNHGKVVDPAELGRRSIEVQAAFEAEVAPVLARFREQRHRQQGLVDRLRFVSPAILLHEGLSDVAGSSVTRHQGFAAQVDTFHADLKSFFFTRQERGAPLAAADYDAMPAFSYREPPDAEIAARVGASVLALALGCAAALAVALAGLRRKDAVTRSAG